MKINLFLCAFILLLSSSFIVHGTKIELCDSEITFGADLKHINNKKSKSSNSTFGSSNSNNNSDSGLLYATIAIAVGTVVYNIYKYYKQPSNNLTQRKLAFAINKTQSQHALI